MHRINTEPSEHTSIGSRSIYEGQRERRKYTTPIIIAGIMMNRWTNNTIVEATGSFSPLETQNHQLPNFNQVKLEPMNRLERNLLPRTNICRAKNIELGC